jgi:hypothetical protein
MLWTWLNPLFFAGAVGLGVVGYDASISLGGFLVGVTLAAGLGGLIDHWT